MIKITLQKTLSSLIISGFVMTSQNQNALADYNPCDGDSTQEMVDCLGLDFDRYERKIQRTIKAQKNKISNSKFTDLQKFHKAWSNSVKEYCGYQTVNPGTIHRINFAYCINDAWRKRVKSIKADLKISKIKQHLDLDNATQQKAKISYLKENKKLTQNVQKVINRIDKEELPDFSKYLQSWKKMSYQDHISAWKDFATAYCSYQGTKFVCLNNLYKEKNKMMQKDYKNYVKIPY